MYRTTLITIGVFAAAALAALILLATLEQHTTPNTTDTATTSASARNGQDPVPAFELRNYDGETVRLADLSAPVLVINLWASWCPFCTDELPAFAKLQNRFPERVEVIAINRGESIETAKGFTDKRGISDELTYLMDPDDSYYRKIGGISMPETLFVGPARTVRIHKRGPMELQEMKDKVERILDNEAQT